MSIETVVENEVKAVEAKAETVAEAVVTEVKKVEGEVAAEVKAKVIQIKTEEKLFLADTELEYLKLQTEIQRLSKLAEEKSKSYVTYVEALFTTYAVTKAEYVFDGAIRALKAL